MSQILLVQKYACQTVFSIFHKFSNRNGNKYVFVTGNTASSKLILSVQCVEYLYEGRDCGPKVGIRVSNPGQQVRNSLLQAVGHVSLAQP